MCKLSFKIIRKKHKINLRLGKQEVHLLRKKLRCNDLVDKKYGNYACFSTACYRSICFRAELPIQVIFVSNCVLSYTTLILLL